MGTKDIKKSKRDKKEYYGKNLSFASQEAYKMLRTNIGFSFVKDESQDGRGNHMVIGITSSSPNEYKSTTALNLAISFAEEGSKTLLLDCDLRKSSIATVLQQENKKGVSDYLVSKAKKEEIINKGLINENLDIILCGTYPPNPSELLSSNKMEVFVDELAEDYDTVIVDLPPVGEVTDALIVSKYCDGIMVVVREGFTSKRDLNWTLRKLEYTGTNILGMILTGTNQKSGYKKYGRYYKRGYYKGYYKK